MQELEDKGRAAQWLISRLHITTAAINSQQCLPAVSPHMTGPVNSYSWQKGTYCTLHSTAGLLAAERFWERGDHCFGCVTTSEHTRLKQIAPTLCSKASLFFLSQNQRTWMWEKDLWRARMVTVCYVHVTKIKEMTIMHSKMKNLFVKKIKKNGVRLWFSIWLYDFQCLVSQGMCSHSWTPAQHRRQHLRDAEAKHGG